MKLLTALLQLLVTLLLLAGRGECQAALPVDFPGTLHSVEEVLSAIPDSLETRPGGDWNAAAVEMASSYVERTAEARPVRFKVQVEYLEAFEDGIRIKALDRTLSGSHPYRVRLWVYFNRDKVEQLSTLTEGQMVEVIGVLPKAVLHPEGAITWLQLDIRNASLAGEEPPTPPAGPKVWVAIRAPIKGAELPPAECFGWIDRSVFDNLRNGPNPSGFLEANDVFWYEDGKLIRASESGAQGRPSGYGNTVYLRADTILRFIPLDEAFVKKVLEPRLK